MRAGAPHCHPAASDVSSGFWEDACPALSARVPGPVLSRCVLKAGEAGDVPGWKRGLGLGVGLTAAFPPLPVPPAPRGAPALPPPRAAACRPRPPAPIGCRRTGEWRAALAIGCARDWPRAGPQQGSHVRRRARLCHRPGPHRAPTEPCHRPWPCHRPDPHRALSPTQVPPNLVTGLTPGPTEPCHRPEPYHRSRAPPSPVTSLTPSPVTGTSTVNSLLRLQICSQRQVYKCACAIPTKKSRSEMLYYMLSSDLK